MVRKNCVCFNTIIMKQTKSPTLIAPLTQTVLLGLGGLLFVTQSLIIGRYLSLVYDFNSFRVSEWSVYLISQLVFPLFFFVLAYWIGVRPDNKRQRGFIALLSAVAATITLDILLVIFSTAVRPFIVTDPSLAAWLMLLPPFLTLILFVLFLLRTKKGQGNKPSLRLLNALLIWSYVLSGAEMVYALITQLASHMPPLYPLHYTAMLAISIILIIGTFKILPAKLSKQQRIFRALSYTLVAAFAYFCAQNIATVLAISIPGGELLMAKQVEIALFLVIPIVYAAFLWILKNKKAL